MTYDSSRGPTWYLGATVRVVVGGDDPTTFSVHESVICEASDYFRMAFNGPWIEAEERKMVLRGVEASIFNLYLNFLYRGEMTLQRQDPMDSGDMFVKLAKLYVLGDMIQDAKVKGAALDTMAKNVDCRTVVHDRALVPALKASGPVVRIIYENTVETSAARRLLLDIYQEFAGYKWRSEPDGSVPSAPSEFLSELSGRMLEVYAPWRDHDNSRMCFAWPCRYHEHDPDLAPVCTMRYDYYDEGSTWGRRSG
ncbi:hypothetical protein N3K66_000168 [Trichothecium roseum]|uniref:Uncharacterized protein n=1 Tax=Trichothecium roseum TaxID=47278 RepID=A0ACC0VB74_9HYPO|nr:hypothetical protein N3K66_000168 [Trichothecium roseum]